METGPKVAEKWTFATPRVTAEFVGIAEDLSQTKLFVFRHEDGKMLIVQKDLFFKSDFFRQLIE